MNKKELSSKTVTELRALAQDRGISGLSKKTKADLVELLADADNNSAVSAVVETTPETVEIKHEPTPEVSALIPQSAPASSATRESAPQKDAGSVDSAASTATATFPGEEKTAPVEEKKQPQPQTDPRPTQQAPQQSQQNQQGGQQAQPQQSQPSNQNNQNNQNSQQNQNNQNQQRNRHNQQRNQQRNRHGNQQNQQRNNQSQNQMQDRGEQVLAGEGQDLRFNNESTVEVSGILEVMSDGTHGVLRSPRLIATDKDTYISISQVKKFRLRKGDFITGIARLPKENERYFSLLWIKDVNGLPVEKIQDRPNFDDLKPVYPNKQIKLEIGQYPIANRMIDLLAPIGFGQRSMIVAQPKSGKTYLLKDIAKGINENYPDVQLIVVLIGERPEEVTDIERSVNGIVYASNFDEDPRSQVAVAELSLERAKRLVELGQDVIILMDSLTRLARAYNVALPASGRTLSGGLDPVSLYPSKRFFGAARNFENGASLTIVATALVDTGSKMDEVIFEEFKGTGNMELHLDRRMSNKRVFPAIDTLSSGTRNEELLLGTEQLQNSWKIRRMLEGIGQDGNEAIIDRMKSTKTNEDFLQTLHQY